MPHLVKPGRTVVTVLTAVLGASVVAPGASAGTERVSVDDAGGGVNGPSGEAAVSGRGRHVAFVSEASNLVAGDTNDSMDVFVRDREAGRTERVSVGSGGTQADGHSFEASISADGRDVAFLSSVTEVSFCQAVNSWRQ
jgi:Tol biopolymer transport system component